MNGGTAADVAGAARAAGARVLALPLAENGPSSERADVQVTGTVYLDLVFSGLAGPPFPGREVRSQGFGASPGGVANLAISLRRLGLAVRLDAAFSTDPHGDYLWRILADQEGVDLCGSVRFDGWPTPLTVSLVYQGDRSMVTYERPQPTPVTAFLETTIPTAEIVFAYLGRTAPTWLAHARESGMRIFADVGWDETELWEEEDLAGLAHVEAFLPNCVEAMAYTGMDSPESAGNVLAERVPLVVVKCGSDGAIGWRAGEASPVREPAIDVATIDPTGAGDVFDAALIYGTVAGWTLQEALRFGNLCAGLSVRHHGGSLSAPTWAEIAGWIAQHPDPDQYRYLQPHLGRAGEVAKSQGADVRRASSHVIPSMRRTDP
ncbi:MAG: carbohydrate kinase family protein [Chloroflexi bacterium]|nr:carbohydrate kinase family protein [Chloroflexota bacterium]